MIQPKYFYTPWGIRGHSQSPGCPGPGSERCVSLFWFRCLWHVGLWESGSFEALDTGTRHDTSHSSCPHLIKIFSQPLLVLCSQWPLLCRTLLSRLFSLRSVHWSLFPVSPLPSLFISGIHYLSLEMELLSNAYTCQYKNCPSHIGGNSLPVSEDSHDKL